ncbi:ComEC/Rec2 family competence protein [Geomesophilobacter sediminis]|uniref:Metallohydrolase n=1 Tax=Geomesophilobacter sediminis TaxID=2798584 RepID=A0A8J7JKU3_9BACT|nr:metallohydrolase [Geomesophilobacter sediminis]MBJ6724190.1 metallohydrolase [Geomesophilobacter sediminis]
MSAKVTFFPVANGDMTLIILNDTNETSILIDVNIRCAADDPEDDTCDVANQLRTRLKTDDKGRPYVDVFVLSHPDQDHCSGLQKHFHLGKLDDYKYEPPEGEELKIVIREIWSSPMVYRRASTNHTLTDDAKAFNTEAKRRANLYKEKVGVGITDGDRILIIGEDESPDKTKGLEGILYKQGDTITRINGTYNSMASMRVLGPFPKDADEEEEKSLQKNHSSVIIQYHIASDAAHPDACIFLTGGDAEVAIWKKLWSKYKNNTDDLKYDLLLAPHHCSWHALSFDSRSKVADPKVDADAKSALSQANFGAYIMSSSKAIKDDDTDPPCHAAKKEYLTISKNFKCTGEYPNTTTTHEPFEFIIAADGPQPPGNKKASVAAAAVSMAREPLSHG